MLLSVRYADRLSSLRLADGQVGQAFVLIIIIIFIIVIVIIAIAIVLACAQFKSNVDQRFKWLNSCIAIVKLSDNCCLPYHCYWRCHYGGQLDCHRCHNGQLDGHRDILRRLTMIISDRLLQLALPDGRCT